MTLALNFTVFILSKIKILRLGYHFVTIDVFKLFSELSPAAPAATLAAPERPSLPTVGTTVTAARIAAHWPPSPLVGVVEAGSAPPL
jgi:hypothetical protein